MSTPTPVIAAHLGDHIVYQLDIKNSITTNNKLILQKVEEKSHSHSGFSIYAINYMLDKYTYDCVRTFATHVVAHRSYI